MVQTLVHDWSLQQKRELSGNERWGVGEDHPTASTGFSCVCVWGGGGEWQCCQLLCVGSWRKALVTGAHGEELKNGGEAAQNVKL